MRTIDVLLLVVALGLLVYAVTGCARQSAVGVVASPSLTPGVLNAAVTQATIGSTICVRGWTATVRPPTSYTSALKLRQMSTYGETGPSSGYQEDHLIS